MFLPITVGMTVLGGKIYHTSGAILGLCLPWTIIAILGVNIIRKMYPGDVRKMIASNRQTIKDMFLRFSLPSALSGLTYMPALWLVYVMLSLNPTTGFVDCGCYTISTNLRMICILAPTLMNNVFLSILSNSHNKSIDNQRSIYWKNLGISMCLSAVPAIILCIAVKPILTIYKYNVDIYSTPSILIIASSVIEVAWLSMYQLYRHREKMWKALIIIALPRDIVFCLASVLLIPKYGMYGDCDLD